MRVTNSMLVNRFMGNLNNNLNKLSKLQTQLANNRKYAHISDDPVSVIYAMQARYKLARVANYRENVQVAREWNESTETAVMDLNKIIQNALDACIDASTDAKTDEDRCIIGANIEQMRDSILTTLNAVYGNKYVFGGYNTTGYPMNGRTIAPFEVDGNGNLTYNGEIISKRTFTGTTSGDAGGVLAAGSSVTVTDNEKLRDMLGSSDKLNIEYSDNASGGLMITVGNQTLTFNTPAELASGNPLVFDEIGIEITLDPAAITLITDTLGAEWGTAPAIAYPDPADPTKSEIVYGLPDKILELSALTQKDLLNFTNTLDTTDPAYISQLMFDRLSGEKMSFDVGPGIEMQAALNGIDVAIYNDNGDNLYKLMDDLYQASTNGMTAKDLSMFISKLQKAQEHVLALTSELGGRQNRLEMLETRYDQDELNYYKMLSNAEDADEAELIMREKMAETVYQAALQTGAYIIQPTLMDFLK